jgi:endo-beta-N-acetylglucosaminidase D
MVMIQEINGKPVPWKLGTSFPNPDDMISDEEINKLLNKGVNGKEPVTESLIRLQSLFGKTL